ncbi:hypothetical protein ACFL6S_27285 [Candidatus Poribacteria bacterium]
MTNTELWELIRAISMGGDMDIFHMANSNSDSLKAGYDSLREKCQEHSDLSTLEEFTELVKDEWAVSINMRQSGINGFLESGRYNNVHELKKNEEERREHLKGYYELRMAFDFTFEDGGKLKYGALNVGGLGADKFGDYCVVFGQENMESYSTLAFVKEDSLRYVDANHTVDIKRLEQDTANRGCVHFLTALKHGGDLESDIASEWASVICCEANYTEAVTADDILNTHIDVVRISEQKSKYFENLLERNLFSELSDPDKYRLEVLGKVRNLLEQQGIELEVLSDGD